MTLLMISLLLAVAPLDRDFKKLPEPGSRFVAARGGEGYRSDPGICGGFPPQMSFPRSCRRCGVAPVRTRKYL